MAGLVKIAADDARLQAAIVEEINALGGDEADASIVGGSGGEAAQDAALNGAQIATLLEIVASMNREEVSQAQATSIVARAFLLSTASAADLVGTVQLPPSITSEE